MHGEDFERKEISESPKSELILSLNIDSIYCFPVSVNTEYCYSIY